jgi:hypothetical protein
MKKKKFVIEYEVIGHHYKTVEVPDEFVDDIEYDHMCEERHDDPIEECIIVQVNEIKENE